MSNATAKQALALWGMQDATVTLVAQRENTVYRVNNSNTGESWALRLHRSGLISQHELKSESQWMQALSQGGLSVPIPVNSVHGNLCESINGQWIDLQAWLAGNTLSHHPTCEHYQALGRSMAQLHIISDEWTRPDDFQRLQWNIEGFVGESPVWGRFWENAALNKQQQLLLNTFRQAATQALMEQQSTLDYGLIHADLVTDNVLVDGQQLHLIDFDDSGFGFRLFDLATVILRLQREQQHEALTKSLMKGYLHTRSLSIESLDLFLALRACTYVGWIIPRISEPYGNARCDRFIKTACTQVARWMNRINGQYNH